MLGGEEASAFYECRPGAAARKLPGGYQRRDVEATTLHRTVRENLATFLLECAQAGGLPRFVARDFQRYLECGVLAHGFSRLVCSGCKEEVLVAYSCKGRGVCCSCNARRAHDTAIHVTHRVLPRTPHRQWTLSFPIQLRYLLARDSALLSEVLGIFMRALFNFQRKAARRLGIKRPHVGALAFLQRFGSALQLTPHFHILLPEAVFEEVSGAEPAVRAWLLRGPDDAEVTTLLRTVALRVVKLLRKRGKLDEAEPCEGALDFLRARATRQQRLPLGEERRLPRQRRRCAFLDGFSLHADTWVHENNREGLERLANYGARGPLSLERLSQLPDGRLAYRMKRPSASGATSLEFTPVGFLRRVAALIPPPRVNLVRFFGVLAPNARLRSLVVPATPPELTLPQEPAPGPTSEPLPSMMTSDEQPTPPPPSRIPWADLMKRTWGVDLLTCTSCGGKRRLVACVFSSVATAEILTHLGLPAHPLPFAPARDPPQHELNC